jgi:hypothetical protein
MKTTMTTTMNSRRCWNLILCWLCLLSFSSAKEISGDFRLSGLNTENVLGSFAISPKVRGAMKITFTSKDPYKDSRTVRIRMYKDDQWPAFKREPSCAEKVPHAIQSKQVLTERIKGKGYVAEEVFIMDNSDEERTHYYYFVIDDCSLELYMHDASIPKMHYNLLLWNDGSHVSADETHLKTLHAVTLVLSGILAALMGMSIMLQLYEKHSVHAAMFWVTAAAACDAGSSFFEILHLSIYSNNGVGSYTLDAISAHLEALCDSLVALLLLSVAAGWTLPSDVIAVTQNASPVQKLLHGLRSPFGALMSFNPTAIMSVGIIASHIILAQWGRMYNDDFDSYHDLEHLPGKLLMWMRMALGLCLIICCFQTRSRCPVSLHAFYFKLAFVGTLWFQSLPVLTWVCNWMVPYHLRHFTVGVWSAGLQTSSIVLLSWLVTSHSTSYHKMSHMSTSEKDNLTDSLTSASTSTEASGKPSVWNVGKAKVRLD